jgi:GDP-4-dehydro-6-deoxy-D-mannose reductase
VSRILITGANGFVGPHIARALDVAGDEVHGIGLGAPPAGVELAGWQGFDLLEVASLEDAVSQVRPDAVVHLAGQSSAAASFADPGGTFRVNVEGTRLLLDVVGRLAPRARILMVSSSEVYGPQPENTRVREEAPCRPVSPYASSKAEAERVSLDRARETGLDVVVARAFGHAGPGQAPRFVLPSFAQQIAAIESGSAEPCLRVGNLEVTRDLSDVRDVARAYAALLRRGRSGAVYNVCRGAGVRLAEVVASLVAQARVPVRVETDPARLRPADVPWLVGDPALIARDTGWSVAIPLEATLRDVLEEWRARAGA